MTTRYTDCPCCNYPKSLSVSTKDGKTLVHCHAGCEQLDVLAALREKPEIAANAAPHTNRDDKSARDYARRLFQDAYPAKDTVVDTYLRERGITIPIPPSIRRLHDHAHKPTSTKWPVMIAAVTDHRGNFQAAHRTYLARDGKAKAPVEPQKMTIAHVGGYSVHLAPAAESMAVTEGIETGLSVLQATGIPTWAALSIGGMRKLVLPPLPLAREVIICADNDAAGYGQKAAQDAAERWQGEGRMVFVSMPDASNTDYNDILRERGILAARLQVKRLER